MIETLILLFKCKSIEINKNKFSISFAYSSLSKVQSFLSTNFDINLNL